MAESNAVFLPSSLWNHIFSFSSQSFCVKNVQLVCKSFRKILFQEGEDAGVGNPIFHTIFTSEFGNHKSDSAQFNSGFQRLLQRVGPFVLELHMNSYIVMSPSTFSAVADHCVKLQRINVCCETAAHRSSISEILSRCTTLKHINFEEVAIESKSDIEEDIVVRRANSEAPNLPQLVEVEVVGISDMDLTSIVRESPNLQSLFLSTSNLSRPGLDGQELVPKPFTNAGLIALAESCHSLEHLRLTVDDVDLGEEEDGAPPPPPISDEGLYSLCKGCPQLKSLTLDGVSRVSAGVISYLSAYCTSLEYLHLENCEGLASDAGSIKLGAEVESRDMPGLTEVNIHIDQHPITLPLQRLLQHSPNLANLSLERCYELADPELVTIAMSPCRTSLSVLNITGTTHITDRGVVKVVEACRGITELLLGDDYADILSVQGVTDASARSIASSLRSLTTLELSFCKITEAGFFSILQGCPALATLTLRGCSPCPPDELLPQLADDFLLNDLETLNLGGVCEASLSAVVAHAPNLKFLQCAQSDLKAQFLSVATSCCRRLEYLELQSCPELSSSNVTPCESLRSLVLCDDPNVELSFLFGCVLALPKLDLMEVTLPRLRSDTALHPSVRDFAVRVNEACSEIPHSEDENYGGFASLDETKRDAIVSEFAAWFEQGKKFAGTTAVADTVAWSKVAEALVHIGQIIKDKVFDDFDDEI